MQAMKKGLTFLNIHATAPRAASQEDTPYLTRDSKAYMRVSLAFLAAGLANFSVLYCVQPVLPIYTHQFHITAAESSLSLSVTTLLLAISLPIAAALSDAFGRKKIMTTSLVVSALCCILTAVCPNFSTLLVIRAIQGVVAAGLPAVAMAYLSEEMEAGSLGFAMGLYISGTSIGGLLGRVLVSYLSDQFTWRIGIASIAVLSLILSLLFWRNLPESRHFTPRRIAARSFIRSFEQQFRDPGLVCLYLVGALLMGGFVTLYNYIGFRLLGSPYHLSQSLVGLIFVVYLVGTFSSSWMGRVADRVGRRKVLLLNVVIMALGAGVTLFGNLWMIILGVAIFTFGFFGGHSLASSWVGRRAVSGKAQASSLYLLFYYVGSSVGGSLGGIFWGRNGWTGTVSMILIFLLMALMMSVVLFVIPPVRKITASS